MPPHHRPRHARWMSRSSRQDPERVDEGQAGRLHQEQAQRRPAQGAVVDRVRGPDHRCIGDLRHPELVRVHLDPHTSRRCRSVFDRKSLCTDTGIQYW